MIRGQRLECLPEHCLTYETRARDRAELFTSGALRWHADGFNINVQHDRKNAVVRVLPYVEDGAVKISAPLPNTTAGRDAAENIRTGVFTGLSIEFQAEREKRELGIRRIDRAFVAGAALVDKPSYGDSTVEVRESGVAVSRSVFLWL